MKKINYLLILITLIFSFVTIVQNLDTTLIVILKNSSIIFTIFLPYIIEKIFKTKFHEGLKTLWIIFIFTSHYLGVVLEYYYKFDGLDKVTHTISGVITAYLALMILEHIKSKKIIFNILFMISFSWLCAGMWEVFEFTCNYLWGGDAQMVARTGVSDTMWDMIVAFFGALGFSIYYYLREKRS